MYYRFEVKKDGQHVRNGVGMLFGTKLNKLRPTPHQIKTRTEHWFTKEGFAIFGNVIKDNISIAENKGYTVVLKKRKKLSNRILFKDKYQVCQEFDMYKKIRLKYTSTIIDKYNENIPKRKINSTICESIGWYIDINIVYDFIDYTINRHMKSIKKY